MQINRVTITGADDLVPIEELLGLSVMFPFVEWGILLSPKRTGTNRYPSLSWIEKLVKYKVGEVNFSAHLCGGYTRDLLQKGGMNIEIIDLVKNYFQRSQINFNFSNTEWKSEHLINLLKDNDTQYILQMNKSNTEVIEAIMDTENFDILYDSSGGRGTEIKTINLTFEKHYTGYSGGLNPDNIEHMCQELTNVNNDTKVFVDCESGVRTDDKFDLEKVEKYLTICSKFIK